MFWRRPNSERKWLEIRREVEGSGWKKFRIQKIIFYFWSKGQRGIFLFVNCLNYPQPLFSPFPTPATPLLHTYVYVCYVYEREGEEEGRREVIA